MSRSPIDIDIVGRPVVYAGRFIDEVRDADLPLTGHIIGDWDVLTSQLAAATEQATNLVLLDLFSFPFEAMTEDQWDIPLIVVLPEGFDADFLDAVFGKPLFEHLGFLDTLVVDDPVVWEKLRVRYRWAECQRMDIESTRPAAAATSICARLEEEAAAPSFFGAHHNPAFAKAVHRVQLAALDTQFAAARGDRIAETPFDVLEVGAGIGHWARGFDPATTRFAGVDVSEDAVGAARTNFPEARFDLLDADLGVPHPDESFDLVFSVGVMHHNPTPDKHTLLSEMWRVTRPGGWLLFLEDFVFEKRSVSPTVHPMSVLTFVNLVLEATAGQVVLEHVEALRYPQDSFFRSGLLVLTKLGVPKTW